VTATPVLHSATLRLVPFSLQHLSDDYVSWLNDEAVTFYSEQRHRNHTIDCCAAYIARTTAAGHSVWAIEVVDKGYSHIGNITASYDRNNAIADIGILIGAQGCQGRGYGATAWGAVLDWLKTDPSLRKITGGCMTSNSAMVRIMQGAGMVPDGVRPQHYLLEGEPVDLVYYAKTT
jgi:RimJ/RimL family protein N-acetyltransferase